MTKLLFVFLICLSFSSSNVKGDDEKKILITIKKDEIKNGNPIENSIVVIIKNNSHVATPVWIMSCNYYQNFMTDNKNVYFPAIECDKNIPKLYCLKPFEEKKMNLKVMYSYSLSNIKIRIGFKLKKENNYKKNLNVIWSNQLTIWK